MAIIIPSKNIYYKENPKIRDNAINGTNGEFPRMKSVHKELATIEWQPFSVTTSSNETVITPQTPNSGNISNINSTITDTNGTVSFDIDINSEQYLDILYGGYLSVVIQIESSFGVGTKVDTNSFYTQPISNKDTKEYFLTYYSNSQTSHPFVNTYIVSPNPFKQPTKNVKINFSFNVSSFAINTLSRFITSVKIQIKGRVLEYPISKTSVGEKNKAITLPTSELSENTFLDISNSTINLYKKGKETAKILASIGEYYEQNGDLAISTKKGNIVYPTWTVSPKDGITATRLSNGFIEYTIPYFEQPQDFSEIGIVKLNRGTYFYEIEFEEGAYGRIGIDTLGEENYNPFFEEIFISASSPIKGKFNISTNGNYDFYFISDNKSASASSFKFKIKIYYHYSKMTFEIGDKVTPMVRRADGTDAPMSRTTSGTAKQFRVCGTKIYYDGAVWQELTLQEV